MRNQNKKKRQDTGFTLIELLAVITIMGILLLVAIPSISNTIKNSRKDTYKTTAAEINTAVKNLVNSDSITCDGTLLSSGATGKTYYLAFKSNPNASDSGYESLKSILDGGATSPFGNKPLTGYVKVEIDNKGKYTYTMSISDGTYGFENKDVKDLTRSQIGSLASITLPSGGNVVACNLVDE